MNAEIIKVALITGAGSGIGRAVSIALMKAGYILVLVGRQIDTLEETARLSGQDKDGFLCLTCDIGKPEQIESMFDKVKQKLGRLDLLFNNAGLSAPAIPMEDLSYTQWQSIVDTTGYRGHGFCIR